jgi:hypothetical protein
MDNYGDDDDNGVSSSDNNDIDIEKIKQELLADDTNNPNFGNNDSVNEYTYDNVDLHEELNSNIEDRDFAEFVISVIKKTIKQEDSLVRTMQIIY